MRSLCQQVILRTGRKLDVLQKEVAVNTWLELIPQGVVDSRVDELAEKVQEWIDSSPTPVRIVPVATGGLWFGFALMQRLRPKSFTFGLVATSSYGDNTTGGGVEVSLNRTGNVEGLRLLVVDDIADRRRTLEELVKFWGDTKRAAEVKICVFLNKPKRKEAPVTLHFVGYDVPNVFVAGYGMDGGGDTELLRSCPNVLYKDGELKPGMKKYTLPTPETMA